MARKTTKRMRDCQRRRDTLINSTLAEIRKSGYSMHCESGHQSSVFVKFIDDQNSRNSVDVEVANADDSMIRGMRTVYLRVVGGGFYVAYVTKSGEIGHVVKISSIEEVADDVVRKLRMGSRKKRPAKRRKSAKSTKRSKATRTPQVKS